MNEEKLRTYIRRMLQEAPAAEESPSAPKPKSARGKTKAGEITTSTGSGRFTTGVNDAGALARDKPKQLMQNLKITSGGDGTLKGITLILKQAIDGVEAMGKAYKGSSAISKGDKKGLKVTMGELDPRNGVKYLQHTLVAAKKVGLFRLKEALQIEVVGGDIVIYFSPEKRSWSK